MSISIIHQRFILITLFIYLLIIVLILCINLVVCYSLLLIRSCFEVRDQIKFINSLNENDKKNIFGVWEIRDCGIYSICLLGLGNNKMLEKNQMNVA